MGHVEIAKLFAKEKSLINLSNKVGHFPLLLAADKNHTNVCELLIAEGADITAQFKQLDESYSTAGGVQCGYCIPGMVMASAALLSKNPHPSEAEIREGISGNLCRCTGYNMIVDAINLAAKKGDGLWQKK